MTILPSPTSSPATSVAVSVVVPVYKEAGNIKPFLQRVEAVMEELGVSYEIIFALDPSPDDTEVVILREIERKLGLAAVLSRHIPDDRDRMRITHSYSDMTRARMFAIASGHEDCDDLDVLRSDPALKMACGRCRAPI